MYYGLIAPIVSGIYVNEEVKQKLYIINRICQENNKTIVIYEEYNPREGYPKFKEDLESFKRDFRPYIYGRKFALTLKDWWRSDDDLDQHSFAMQEGHFILKLIEMCGGTLLEAKPITGNLWHKFKVEDCIYSGYISDIERICKELLAKPKVTNNIQPPIWRSTT